MPQPSPTSRDVHQRFAEAPNDSLGNVLDLRIKLARINHTDHHRWPGSTRVLSFGMSWSGTIRIVVATVLTTVLIFAVGVTAFALVTYVWF
jgi:hypothetical protein